MPDRKSHLDKAVHNEAFLKSLFSKGLANYHDWIVTVAFYTALQCVDASLSRLGYHPTTHVGPNGRNALVSIHLRSVASKFQTLYTRSRYARYIPYSERRITLTEVNRLCSWVTNFFMQLP